MAKTGKVSMQLTDQQYMELARMAEEHADCKKSQVGAALVLPNGMVLVGSNGSPFGQVRCVDGGCYRCAHPEIFASGERYDLCTCVHAEEDCLTQAAKHGVSVVGSTLYCTLRPCRGCSKLLIQAGIVAVYFEHELPVEHLEAYLTLQGGFSGGVHKFAPAEFVIQEVRVPVPV
jgi:dCMP deaminase